MWGVHVGKFALMAVKEKHMLGRVVSMMGKYSCQFHAHGSNDSVVYIDI
jgi:hypothetical protein